MVDALCGSGKTTWACHEIEQHPEKSYVYVTPFLDEVKDIRNEVRFPDGKKRFREPTYKEGRKIVNFNALLESGLDVISTHSTFSNSTDQTVEHIQNGKYTLILDEVIDVLESFNDVCGEHQQCCRQDIRMLLERNLIAVDTLGRVSWIGESYEGGKFTEVERLAKRGNLVLVDGTLLVWEFPIDVFKAFESVIILTYLFDGSMLKSYLDYHGIAYEMRAIQKGQDGVYTLADYHKEECNGKAYRDLIQVFSPRDESTYRGSRLSKSWYSVSGEEEQAKRCTLVKNDLQNFFRKRANEGKRVHAGRIMLTSPKDVRNQVCGAGFTWTRRMTEAERKLCETDRNKTETKLRCWVACNARATDDFAERDVLAYAINLYVNPYFVKHFEKKGVSFDKDAYALSSMIQWVWRSAIRRGKPIKLYILSNRMRELFLHWLNGEDIQTTKKSVLKKEVVIIDRTY